MGKYREPTINNNVIQLFGDRISPEQHLWVSVIVKAAEDALKSNYFEDALKAIDWFKRNSGDFKQVCMFAGHNPEYIRGKILARALKREKEIIEYIQRFKNIKVKQVNNTIPIIGTIS